MNTIMSLLEPMYLQIAIGEVNLRPLETHQFSRSQPMAKHQQDHGCISDPMSAYLTCSLDEGLLPHPVVNTPVSRCDGCLGGGDRRSPDFAGNGSGAATASIAQAPSLWPLVPAYIAYFETF